MKIAILSRGIPSLSAPMNGCFEWDQACALRDAGHDVRFLVQDYRRVWDEPWGYRHYTREGIEVFSYHLPTGMYRHLLPVLQRRTEWLYGKMCRSVGEAEVVHAHFYFMGALTAGLVRHNPKLKVVLTEHSSKLVKPLAAISALDQRLARLAYRSANGLLCVSDEFARRLHSNFGFDYMVVPNVVDLASFGLELASGAKGYWVSCGLLIERKRMLLLLQAFARLPQEEAVSLVIIGDGPLHAALQREVARLSLQERVRMVGMLPREEMAALYRNAHAFVLLSASETFGVAYVEAMAMGLPVVATRCGGPEQFVRPGEGLVVPVDDVEAATEAMHQLACSTINREAIAKGVRERFAPEAIARQLTAYYATLCNPR